ncbi:hypothetical protein vseg_002043 [Gypsophila vaccaria]
MGLDNTLHGTVRSQQLMLDLLPTLNRAYHVVLQEERLRGLVPISVDAPDILAYAVRSDSRPNTQLDWREIRDREKTERRKFYCTHCHARGHDIKSCFFRTGAFPEWWGDRPRTLGESRVKLTTPSGGTRPPLSTALRCGSESVRAHVVTFGVDQHAPSPPFR